MEQGTAGDVLPLSIEAKVQRGKRGNGVLSLILITWLLPPGAENTDASGACCGPQEWPVVGESMGKVRGVVLRPAPFLSGDECQFTAVPGDSFFLAHTKTNCLESSKGKSIHTTGVILELHAASLCRTTMTHQREVRKTPLRGSLG